VYIEDNPANLTLIQRLLAGQRGIRLITATRGGAGLQLAQEHRPDVILLDVHLPDLSGLDVMNQLKRRAETKDIPVIIVSADASPGQSKRLLAAGAWRSLTKPLDIKQFQAVLDEALIQPE
jgi:CheY-like chemotaxis protein